MDSPTNYHSPVFSPSPLLSATLSSPELTTQDCGVDSYTSRTQRIPRSHFVPSSTAGSRGIRKRPSTRRRSASTSYAGRLRHIDLNLFGDSNYCNTLIEPTSNLLQWCTPQHSPQPSSVFPIPDTSYHPSYKAWSVPTPPRSDAGLLSVSADAADEQPPALCGGDLAFDQLVTSAEMSSLEYLLPGQYANVVTQPDVNAYDMDSHRAHSVTTAQSPYSQTASSSPSLYQGRIAPQYGDGRHGGSASSSYYAPTRRATGPYDSPATSDYSLPSTHSVPPFSGIASSLPPSVIASPSMGGLQPHYSSVPRAPGMYDTSYYGQPHSYTTAPAHAPMYAPQGVNYAPAPYASSDQMSRASSSDLSTRAGAPRPKAQCWEHGCNGRQFSTFSNLLRHQREKSGTATKSSCPKCGAEFTRTTARNGHLLHDKCTKTRRPSEER